VSSEPRNSSRNKTRPSFKELLAKYEKKGTTQKKKKQLDKANDAKPLSRHQEQLVSYPRQGNCVDVPYGLIAPWFW